MMKYVLSFTAVALVAGSAMAAVPADNSTKVQDTLKAQGYSKWKRVELDQGVWEIDDAIDAAGRQFDLRISDGDMKTISKVAE